MKLTFFGRAQSRRRKRYGLARGAVNALILALLATPVAGEPVAILALGDSLTAGYGLGLSEAFPARLAEALGNAGIAARVIDAGVSGDTTAGGLARLDWALAGKPDLVILELGGNDALRGVEPAATRANLDAILARLAAAGVRTLLAGMLAPRNLGPEYVAEFDAIYPELAARYDVPLYPFFLAGVAGDPALVQPDGIHPNAAGVLVVVERILPYVLRAIGGEP